MNFFAKLSFILIIIASALPAQAQLHKKKVLMPDPLLQRPGKVLANTAIIRVTDNYTLAELSAIFDKNDFNILRPLMKRNKSLTFNQNIKGAELFSSGKKHEILKAESPLLRTYIIEFQGDMPPEVFCKRITKIYPIIEYAEPYKAYSILESTVNDPRSTDQAGLNNIRAFEAFEIFQGDTSVIIGIIDSGVNQYHEDLHEQIAPNWDEIPNNQIDDDQNGYIDDHIGYNFGALDDSEWGNTNHVNPHGTQVAGIAAAGTNNSIGIAGAAYNCRFFPLKMSQGQENSFIYGYDAIMYAAEREFDVINLSFGDGDFYSPVEQSIIDYAVSRGVAVVASGGNIGNGTVMQSTVYPAGYFGVLGVGETSQHDRVSGGSVLGFPVDIMAPGENNWTTALSGGYQQAPGGTSFAAPVISGAVAYARALYPELGPIQALEFVRQAVDNINDLNPSYEDLLPGRINYMKIIETDPMDIPAIVPLEVIYSNEEGEPLDRFSVGD
ncbi:MAG: S8 family peptidase, partial [Bacteroidota bacterium]